jgi:hypothetical protein
MSTIRRGRSWCAATRTHSDYDILARYEALTGLPVLINTSFNAREEPIINTPDEAIAALKAGRVDAIVTDGGLWSLPGAKSKGAAISPERSRATGRPACAASVSHRPCAWYPASSDSLSSRQ